MKNHSLPPAPWRTASFADGSDSIAVENFALGKHLGTCKRHSGSSFAFRHGAELIHGFCAGRFVTTLALIAVVIGLSAIVL